MLWIGIGIGLVIGNMMMLLAMMLGEGIATMPKLERVRPPSSPSHGAEREPSGTTRL